MVWSYGICMDLFQSHQHIDHDTAKAGALFSLGDVLAQRLEVPKIPWPGTSIQAFSLRYVYHGLSLVYHLFVTCLSMGKNLVKVVQTFQLTEPLDLQRLVAFGGYGVAGTHQVGSAASVAKGRSWFPDVC